MLGNFLLCGLPLLLLTGLPSMAGESSDYLWWHIEGKQREADAGMTATFTLCGADAERFDSLEFFYTTAALRNYGSGRGMEATPERTAWRRKVTPATRRLTLYSGRYEQLELWAVARAGPRTWVTQTAVNLYGQSELEKSDFERIPELPALPGLALSRQRGYYDVMTGERITFRLDNLPAGAVRVLLEGEPVAELRPEGELYRYVCPRNRQLTGKALLQYRDLLFIPEVAGNVHFTCCLPLYRSMRDNLDYNLGLVLLGSSLALSLGAVWLKGRRFLWR